jgi:DNA invertase Pin-like site-specific DNA recombinase
MSSDETVTNQNGYKDLVVAYVKKQAKEKQKRKGKFVIDDGVKPTYVIYARKSTEDKEKQPISVETQVFECLRYADLNELKIYKRDEPLHEDKSAMVAGKRDVFDEMIAELNKVPQSNRKYNSILCWAPDRLSRNMLEAGMIIDLLDRKKIIDIKFPSFNFTNDHNGLLTLGFHFLMAKEYSGNLSVNVKRGQDRKMNRGADPNAKDAYGYLIDRTDKNNGGFYIPDGKNFNLMKEGFKMAIEKQPFREIAKYLNDNNLTKGGVTVTMSKQILSRVMSNPLYCGILVFGERVRNLLETDPNFKPMISFQDYYSLRLRFDTKTSFRRQRGDLMLLRGMVNCDYCGKIMNPSIQPGHTKKYLWLKCMNSLHCPSYSNKPKANPIRSKVIFDYCYEKLKSGMYVSKKEFEEIIKEGISERKKLVDELMIQRRSKQSQLVHKERAIEESRAMVVNASLSEITRKMEGERIDHLYKEKAILETEEAEIYRNIGDLTTGDGSEYLSYDGFSNFCKKIGESILNPSSREELDTIIRMAFSNFIIRDGKVLKHQYNPNFEKYLNPDSRPTMSG